MFRIRPMHANDFDAVRWLDRDVFVAWGREHRGLQGTRPPRTVANVRENHADDPAGCFVAVKGDEVVGYIFSHTWGRVGWFGTFGVRPDCRGQGIGSALIERSVAYLVAAGCTTVGLATMPDSTTNIGLYMRHGFAPDGLALRLMRAFDESTLRSLSRTGAGLPWRLWRALPPHERGAALDSCAALTDALWPGLDYRKVIQYVPGETLLWGDPRAVWGFAAVRTIPKLDNSRADAAVVDALVVRPDHADQWPAVIRSLEAFTVSVRQGLRGLAFSLPGRQREPLATALAAGYRFVHVNLVMARCRPAIQWEAGVHSFAWLM